MHTRKLHAALVAALASLVATTGMAAASHEAIDHDFQGIDLQEIALVANLASIGLGTEPDGVVIFEGHGGRGGGHGLAAANCQWLLAVNTIVATVFTVDQLGLVNDEDSVFAGPALTQDPPPLGGNTTIIANGTASCEQDVGPVFVRLHASDGFGEPAPQAEGIVEAMGSIASARLSQFGDPPQVDQDVENIQKTAISLVANIALMEIHGTGNSASNCQLAITWNTAVLNDITVNQEGTVNDGDSVTELRGDAPGAGLSQILPPPFFGDVEEQTWATSHCRQTVDSITLTTGDEDVPRLPPQS